MGRNPIKVYSFFSPPLSRSKSLATGQRALPARSAGLKGRKGSRRGGEGAAPAPWLAPPGTRAGKEPRLGIFGGREPPAWLECELCARERIPPGASTPGRGRGPTLLGPARPGPAWGALTQDRPFLSSGGRFRGTGKTNIAPSHETVQKSPKGMRAGHILLEEGQGFSEEGKQKMTVVPVTPP